MSTQNNKKTNKKTGLSYILLLGLATLFAAPLVAAWGVYGFSGSRIGSMVNKGHLIQPPYSVAKLHLKKIGGTPLTVKQMKGKWTLLYIQPKKTCKAACQQALVNMRQVRLALGENMDRVVRAVATVGAKPPRFDELLEKSFKGTHHVLLGKGVVQARYKKSLAHAMRNGGVLVVDPLGNIMMEYDLTQPPKAMYQDLKRLLKYSHVG